MPPRPLRDLPGATRRGLRWVLADIDDTLTSGGRLEARAYAALERLHDAGLEVIPITGRPAGWCDLIARLWPVSAIVGENGAVAMRYDRGSHAMRRRFWLPQAERATARRRLAALGRRILAAVPGTGAGLRPGLPRVRLGHRCRRGRGAAAPAAVERVVGLFAEAGACAKVSSIHVNGWFGDWDKLAMTRGLFREQYGVDLDAARRQVVFVGDSPNDAPMFGHFANSVGVANVARFLDRIAAAPGYIADGDGGAGFVELAEAIMEARAA